MISTYLKKLPKDKQVVLLKLQALVFKHLPDVVESLEYKMPTYRIDGNNVLAFASQKHYFSVYIMNITLKEKYASDFAHLSTGKSCIRFKRLEQFPLDAFAQLLQEIR